jgi:hypothetical protein
MEKDAVLWKIAKQEMDTQEDAYMSESFLLLKISERSPSLSTTTTTTSKPFPKQVKVG